MIRQATEDTVRLVTRLLILATWNDDYMRDTSPHSMFLQEARQGNHYSVAARQPLYCVTGG